MGGKTNACYNCVDRHVEQGFGQDIAITWENSDLTETKKISYIELLANIQKFSNVLKNNGVKKGDRVCIYLQMIPEIVVAVLACARIGAVHNVVFGGFSTDSLVDRIHDSTSSVIITQDNGVRGAKYDIPMFKNCWNTLEKCPTIQKIIVVNRTKCVEIKEIIEKNKDKCTYFEDEMEKADAVCPCEELDSEDPIFIL